VTIVDAHHHVWDLTASYADVHAAARSLTADLSQAAVFRGTAVRAYGLKPSR
jgi:predicted TIM-barrel fold metal-dependent hydrolase